MAIAKTIEIIAASTLSVDDAIKQGIAKASETVSGIEGFWVKDVKGTVRGDKIAEWRVHLMLTFIVR
jgi:flavin-binding protein dodecin